MITKDRRDEPSCRDVLQVVRRRSDGFLFEVQFHYASVFPLKVFSHAAYNICRPEDKNLTAFTTIFKFPAIDMQDASPGDVRCKLHLDGDGT